MQIKCRLVTDSGTDITFDLEGCKMENGYWNMSMNPDAAAIFLQREMVYRPGGC